MTAAVTPGHPTETGAERSRQTLAARVAGAGHSGGIHLRVVRDRRQLLFGLIAEGQHRDRRRVDPRLRE
ncbi:MAG: hypothetical protein WA417_02625 [Stellaceae bacterium]